MSVTGMANTPISLLDRASRQTDADAWRRLAAIYEPLLVDWLRGQGLQPNDADDVVQDVLIFVAERLPSFRHNGRTGAFRTWLRRILVNRLRKLRLSRKRGPTPGGGSKFLERLHELQDPVGNLSQFFEQEHDRRVVAELLRLARPKVSETTWEAFRLTVIEGLTPAAASPQLGLSPNAVCAARARVLHQLRREGRGLLE